MQCPKCGAENRVDARFCVRCGGGLTAAPPAGAHSDAAPQVRPTPARGCTACGTSLKPGAHFCPQCGAAVAQFPLSPSGSVPTPARPLPQATEVAFAPRMQDQAAPLFKPGAHGRRPMASSPDVEPTPVRRDSHGRARWLLGLLTAVVSGLCVFCAVLGLAVGSVFGDTVTSLPATDPSHPDLTLYVGEAYVSEMMGETLPGGIRGETSLDVRPQNLLVLTTRLDLLFMKPEIAISSRLSVIDGRIHIKVEDVDAGGHQLLNLIGVDEVTLGDELLTMIQSGLERELGSGSRLLGIATDDNWIILEARLDADETR